MSTDIDPKVGDWYQRLDKDQKFEVVALDEAGGTVHLQHFDGDLEEIDVDEWYQMDLESMEAPEDWTGPLDDVQRDDLGYSETGRPDEDLDRSLLEIEQSPEPWEEEEPDVGSDDAHEAGHEDDEWRDEI